MDRDSVPIAETRVSADSRVAGRDAGRAAGRVSSLERRLVTALARQLGSPRIAFVLWNGEEISSTQGSPVARVRIGDRSALYHLLLRAELSFGDLYADGRLGVEGDLVEALETVYRSISEARAAAGRDSRRFGSTGPRRANTIARSRANARHHYDLGNDFYSLWLDPEHMQYTCAYYPRPGMTLEQAQRAKLHHVCRKVRLRKGDRVIEAGGGWGGLALFMAREYGATVRSFNISSEQVAFARRRARQEGLESQVEFIEDDYRAIEGQGDVFVSVGMLEHVGPKQYGELGRVIDRCLAPAGRGLIHTIGRNQPASLNRWIEKRIFPGSHPPTLRRLLEVFEPRGFSILDVENLRLHYEWTLRHWLERYEAKEDRVRRMFDERFVRTWRLYLAGSAAAFATGSLQLFQVVFHRPMDNDLPRSRAHLYDGDG